MGAQGIAIEFGDVFVQALAGSWSLYYSMQEYERIGGDEHMDLHPIRW